MTGVFFDRKHGVLTEGTLLQTEAGEGIGDVELGVTSEMPS